MGLINFFQAKAAEDMAEKKQSELDNAKAEVVTMRRQHQNLQTAKVFMPPLFRDFFFCMNLTPSLYHIINNHSRVPVLFKNLFFERKFSFLS